MTPLNRYLLRKDPILQSVDTDISRGDQNHACLLKPTPQSLTIAPSHHLIYKTQLARSWHSIQVWLGELYYGMVFDGKYGLNEDHSTELASLNFIDHHTVKVRARNCTKITLNAFFDLSQFFTKLDYHMTSANLTEYRAIVKYTWHQYEKS